MRSDAWLHLIIPTRAILEEFQPAETILALADTTPRGVVEQFLTSWVEHRTLQHLPGFREIAFDSRGRHSVGARLYATDLIFDAMERRHEQLVQEGNDALPPIREADRKDLERVLMEIWALLSNELFPLFEELRLTEAQIDQLQFVRWTGDDVVILIPRAHYDASKELE